MLLLQRIRSGRAGGRAAFCRIIRRPLPSARSTIPPRFRSLPDLHSPGLLPRPLFLHAILLAILPNSSKQYGDILIRIVTWLHAGTQSFSLCSWLLEKATVELRKSLSRIAHTPTEPLIKSGRRQNCHNLSPYFVTNPSLSLSGFVLNLLFHRNLCCAYRF